MSKNKDKELVKAEDNSKKLEEVFQEIPDDELLEAFASRFKFDDDPSTESIEVVRRESYSGPIPPPRMLNEYNSVEDGLASRIVSMAESQQKHRHDIEKTSVNAAVGAEKRGQDYALIVSVIFIIGSIYLIAIGQELSGTIIAGTTLLGLAYMFLTGRKRKKTDEEKDSEPEKE